MPEGKRTSQSTEVFGNFSEDQNSVTLNLKRSPKLLHCTSKLTVLGIFILSKKSISHSIHVLKTGFRNP